MNYIRQLKRGVAARDVQLRSIDQSVVMFLDFLHGPKFTCHDNGERKDWIATGDLIAWLREMQSASHHAGECAAVGFTPSPSNE